VRCPCSAPICALTSASISAWASTRTPSRKKSDIATVDLAQQLHQFHGGHGHRGQGLGKVAI
jgi:hypothetical protein